MLKGVNGIRLNVHDEGEGEPILFLHALGAEAAMWTPQVERFRRSHRVVTYDHRGFGKSDRTYGPLTMELLANDAAALLDVLAIDRCHVVGLSMGGMVAQEFALLCPDRTMTLTICDSFADPGPGRGQMQEAAGTASLDVVTTPGIEALMFAPKTAGDPESPAVRWLRQSLESTDPICFARARDAIANFSATERLPAVGAPTLIICGEHDNLTPLARSEELARLIANAELKVIAGAGHFSNLENPSAFNEALETHITRAVASV